MTVKTTIEIDDDLYRQAKDHAVITGQKMKDLVTTGLRLALLPEGEINEAVAATDPRELEACFADADEAMQSASHNHIARDYLAKGRDRLIKP